MIDKLRIEGIDHTLVAETSNKLGTKTEDYNIGNTNTPIYFNNGLPVTIDFTIEKSVPADAIFTDTTYDLVTTDTDGLMSSVDKQLLDDLINDLSIIQTTADEFRVTNSDDNNKIILSCVNGIQVQDITTDNIIKITSDDIIMNDNISLNDVINKISNLTINKLDTPDSGYSATYQLISGDTVLGDKINIPRDLVVQSGSVKTVESENTPVEGYMVGDKYIDLLIANSDDEHIYILVSDLVEGVGEYYFVDNVKKGEIFNNYDSNIASGEYSHAEGDGSTASGEYSHAEGDYTIASGDSSHAEGCSTTASGDSSHAEGSSTTASDVCSHAEGGSTTASGEGSHAEGGITTASGDYSHAEGFKSITKGDYSHAEGYKSIAKGNYSHAEGYGSTTPTITKDDDGNITDVTGSHMAVGEYSHVEGYDCIAKGNYSHAGGTGTIASGEAQTVIGKYNVEDTENKYVFIIGNGTSDNRSNAFAIDWNSTIYQNNSETGINLNDLKNTTDSITIQKLETAETGYSTSYELLKNGVSTGDKINIPKDLVVEQGSVKECTVENNPVQGYNIGDKYIDLVIANSNDEHIYILVSDLVDNYELPIASTDVLGGVKIDGTTINIDDTGVISGVGAKVINVTDTVTNTGEIFNDYVNNKATGNLSHAEGNMTNAMGTSSHAEGISAIAFGECSHAEGKNTLAKGKYSHVEGYSNTSITYKYDETDNTIITDIIGKHMAVGISSHVEGKNCIANGTSSHAEGSDTIAYYDYSHAEGSSTKANGTSAHAEGNDTTAGNYSHAEGNHTTASGQGSHAEGISTTASGPSSHAEGNFTTSSGMSSHSEGGSTTAEGMYSHAEGEDSISSGEGSHAEGVGTVANGESSHAGGKNTIASGEAQTAIGKWNIEDTENKYAFIIGNGDSSTRSNVLSVSWNGSIIINNVKSVLDTTLIEGLKYQIGELTEDITITLPGSANSDIEVDFAAGSTIYNITCSCLSLNVVNNTYYKVLFSYDKTLNMWFSSIISFDYIPPVTEETDTDNTNTSNSDSIDGESEVDTSGN